MIDTSHPMFFVTSALRDLVADQDLQLQFVTYVPEQANQYGPADESDRQYIWIAASEVTPEWLEEDIFDSLGDDEVFGFTGLVRKASDPEVQYFIPALDMKDFEPTSAALTDLVKLLAYVVDGYEEPVVFKTDNSFHIYFRTIRPHSELPRFLGTALLFNANANGERGGVLGEQVDTRWAGHALVRDCPTLRWSRHIESFNPKSAPPARITVPGFDRAELFLSLDAPKIAGTLQARKGASLSDLWDIADNEAHRAQEKVAPEPDGFLEDVQAEVAARLPKFERDDLPF